MARIYVHHFHELASIQLPLVRMESLTRHPSSSPSLPVLSRRVGAGWLYPFSHSFHRLLPEASSGGSACKGKELLPAVRPQNMAEVSAWEPRTHAEASAWLTRPRRPLVPNTPFVPNLPQPPLEVSAAGAVGPDQTALRWVSLHSCLEVTGIIYEVPTGTAS